MRTGILLILLGVIGIGAVSYVMGRSKAETEGKAALAALQTAHAGEKAIWLFSQRNANSTILGLRRQIEAALTGCREDREAEERRFSIFANATVQAVPTGGIADDATDKAAVRHINAAFARACGLRGKGAGACEQHHRP